MRKFHQPRCPYCGKKLGLANTWILKSQGEYLCPKCGGVSNIVLDGAIYLIAFFAVLVSAIFFVAAFLHLVPVNLWMILLVVLPFFLFFLISVFLVRLKKPEIRKKPVSRPMAPKILPPDGPGSAQNRGAAPGYGYPPTRPVPPGSGTVPGRGPMPPSRPGGTAYRRPPNGGIPRR